MPIARMYEIQLTRPLTTFDYTATFTRLSLIFIFSAPHLVAKKAGKYEKDNQR